MKNSTKKPLSPKIEKLNELLSRRRGIRELNKRFLIVCEDTKSAKNYFDAFIRNFRIGSASVRITSSGGNTQPIQVVQEAISLKKQAEKYSDATLPFDEIWCVIDGDYGNKIENARNSANSNGVKLAITTMCFEHWILLHFEKNNKSSHDCNDKVKDLKKRFVPDYEKGTYDYKEIVKDARKASKHAKQLRNQEEWPRPENQNPCSELYLLVDELLKNVET
jgi:RloB-like protein